MSLSLRFAAGSHKGMIREGNEDSGYAGPRLLAIADGMGGAAAGEVASSEAISTIVALDDDVPGSDLLTSLGQAVQRANDQLRMMVEEDPQLEGMGTTLTALLWTGQRLGMVHVGDSRAYLLRDGVLTQITQDHTWVQRLVDEGRITEEEATTHPQRSLLMRALGSGEHVEPDLSIREVRAGDRYLICSDGLSGVVSHQTLEEALASYQGPEETVQNLIELALRGGGPDNITVIVADVLDLDTGDTLAGQLSDTPVVVGAVAENQNQLHDNGIMQTPAGRASGLGRRRGEGGGEFGPPGSGDVTGFIPTDGFGYGDDDFVKPGKNRRWLKRSVYGLLALAVIGGGPVRRLALDPDPVLRRHQRRARRAVPGHQPGPGLGLALGGREGPPRDRTQVPAALPAEAGRGDHRRGRPLRRAREDRGTVGPGLRVQEAGRAARRPEREEREDRRGRGRRHHGNHPRLLHVQGLADAEPLGLAEGPGGVHVPVHDRTYSQPRPQPLGGRAEGRLAVR
ncbi:serine/threonine protein phosphatase PrpC [Streptomyces sp. SLBN-134]|nr:serine/threonine protein phosphatase PrpC [Streptomyces sp. SLBN-134]